MKTAILASALLLAIPLSAPAAESDLYGAWKLVSLNSKLVDTGQVDQPRGKAPRGYVTYGRDGRFFAIILSEQRPKPESVAKMTDQQRIDLFKTMNAFGGTYKLDGNKLTYQIDISHNELETQRALVRDVKIEGRKLTLVTAPAPGVIDGKMRSTTTVWEKVQAPAPAKK